MTPLKARRMLARGLNRRHVGLLGGRYFRGVGNRAMLTTEMAGANNDLTFIARTPGAAGNNITVEIVTDTPGSIVVAWPNTITITVPVGTTAAAVADLVNRHVDASMLVWAQVKQPGDDGTGAVVAMAATNLSGAI